MMIYISCAKTMTARSRQQVPYTELFPISKKKLTKMPCTWHSSVPKS